MNSISSRVLHSITGNVMKSLINFFTTFFIAGILTPEDFGRMSYLLAIFVAIRQILDSGITSAFFTYASQKRMNRFFYLYYFSWLIIQLFISILFLLLIFPFSLVSSFLNNENIWLVLLVFIASFAQGIIWQSAQYLAESERKTGLSQLVGVLITFTHLIVIILGNECNYISLEFIFAALILEYLIGAIIIVRRLKYLFAFNNLNEKGINQHVSRYSFHGEVRKNVKLFGAYCLPLIPYTFITVFQDLGDRWLLKEFADMEHQAYYTIAMQFSAISLLATSSVLQIFWKEFAEAYENNLQDRFVGLYGQTVKVLFLLSVFSSMFLVPHGEIILRWLLGENYGKGALTFTIMLIYPIYQVVGQVGGTVLYATESTRLRFNLASIFLPVSLVTSFILLAPNSQFYFTLGLGSFGLSVKMILIQFLYTSVLNYYLWKKWGMKFSFLFQFKLIILFLAISYISKLVIDDLHLIGDSYVLFTLLMYFLFYLTITVVIIWKFPSVLGFSRLEIDKLLHRMRVFNLF
jgi:O-antigen/teichoic acid export membrane protein